LPADTGEYAEYYTKLNFILGQCSKAEIQAGPLWRWLLVNTGWTNYKIQSVLSAAFVTLAERFFAIREGNCLIAAGQV